MQTWVAVFVVIAAVAVLLQTVVLLAFYFLLRKMSHTFAQASNSLDTHLIPLLHRARLLIDDSQTDLHDIVHETAEVARMVRANGRRFDRVLEEGADRLRLQIIHADRLLTGAFETIEDTSQELRKSFVEPLRTVSAFVKGIQAGVDFFRRRSRMPERRREAEDEGLFV